MCYIRALSGVLAEILEHNQAQVCVVDCLHVVSNKCMTHGRSSYTIRCLVCGRCFSGVFLRGFVFISRR